jgi:hypothetical protein
MRTALDGFVGMKILPTMSNDIKSRVGSTLQNLVDLAIISTFDSNIVVEQEPNDPSFFRVTAFYVPIFGLKYIECTFNLRTQL